MFEPMGGSAPKYTGLNVINPLATICAGGMMMGTLSEPARPSCSSRPSAPPQGRGLPTEGSLWDRL